VRKVTYKITPTGISVFTGIGGMDIGFRRAGGRVLLGADWEIFPGIVHTNNRNNPKAELRSDGAFLSGEKDGDITKIDGKIVLDHINNTLKLKYVPGQIDFLFGGPPCPPFSIANPKKNPFDKRATLIFHMLKLVREVQPKVVVIEQVPQVVTSKRNLPFWNKLKMVLNSMTDYIWDYKILNAMNYGGRQNRKRCIFYLVHKSLEVANITFPEHTAPDMSKQSARVLLPHIQHFSSGQGNDVVHSSLNRMFLTVTAGASEWAYEDGVKRKFTVSEKQIMTETEGQNLDGLNQTEKNTGMGNMVSPSLMEALTHHASIHFLKIAEVQMNP
jgi:C-5 cytosine-specific DNA methylase